MDTAVAVALIVAAALALGDWFAVGLGRHRVESVLKPATLAALLVAAVVGDVQHDAHWLVVAALALGLLGDVALLRSSPDQADGWFLAGLAAFLLGHVAYLVAFLRVGVHGWETVGGALFAVGVGGLALPAVLRGAARIRGRELAVLVGAYALFIAVMAAAAAGTTLVLTAIGGGLFVVSDAVLAREQFVGQWRIANVPAGKLAVIITYHGAQALILLGLLHASWLPN